MYGIFFKKSAWLIWAQNGEIRYFLTGFAECIEIALLLWYNKKKIQEVTL